MKIKCIIFFPEQLLCHFYFLSLHLNPSWVPPPYCQVPWGQTHQGDGCVSWALSEARKCKVQGKWPGEPSWGDTAGGAPGGGGIWVEFLWTSRIWVAFRLKKSIEVQKQIYLIIPPLRGLYRRANIGVWLLYKYCSVYNNGVSSPGGSFWNCRLCRWPIISKEEMKEREW